ncbi:PREDICTED: uncharacterized protein LOC108970189 [Bactrocera latifrons]|uniref:uncharacterized protein LOC108970189 n=1 Tax=Bactrocera latifrons TaxID=174628 RepID=UPI0008DD0F41|nr:PREDICTED: uncharacterized protein LOC108970189 [Bactrocera latifrons]
MNSHLYCITKLSWLLVFMLVFWHRAAQGLPSFSPNECEPGLSLDPRECAHGAFDLNMNRTNCEPRMVCYRNIGEPCQELVASSNCLPPLVCNCGKCSEVLSYLCRKKMPPILNMSKRMKPVYTEYVY